MFDRLLTMVRIFCGLEEAFDGTVDGRFDGIDGVFD